MKAPRTLLLLPLLLIAVAPDDAAAQAPAETVITRGQDGGTPLKSGRVIDEEKKSLSPGADVFERMGADLPPLPPEKPFTGTVDEAYGAYQRGYYLTAMDLALPRAQLGAAAAQTLIAELTSKGLGVRQDLKAAAFWYGEAAKNGDPNAMFSYAMLLMEGRHVPRDQKRADALMKKAADAGNASAQFNHAQVFVADAPGPEGLKTALPYYEKAADQGIADAQYAVAQIYATLPDLPEAKKTKARDYLVRAARAGFDTAELDMGIWLVNGVGGPRDAEEGYKWLEQAARRGNVAAQNKVAHLLINAIGTRPNPVEAAKWYVLSRRAGMKDPLLEDFYLGITEEEQKKAIEAANAFRRS